MGSDGGENGEVWTRERCYIREIVNDPAIGQFSLAEARVEPGITTERHRLDVDEWYVLVRGEGTVTVGDAPPRAVKVGDVVPIPAGTSQQIENTGDSDLVFQCICLPRFTSASYEPLPERS